MKRATESGKEVGMLNAIDRLQQSFSDNVSNHTPKVTRSDEDDTQVNYDEDENEARGNWSGRLEFFLACLGYAVGLGSVWRFPFLVYDNGGAVFFIPYLIFLVFVGMPLFFLELSLGQYTSRGPLSCWEMAPIFKGLGVGMLVVSALLSIYYNVIIAWAMFYLFASFTSDLPWKHCDRHWNDHWCSTLLDANVTVDTCINGLDYIGGVCWNNSVPIAILNNTLAKANKYSAQLPAEQYLNNHALGVLKSTGIDNLGGMDYPLPLCLMLAWVIVVLALVKGIKSSGKVVYFTALFPYVVLLILLVRGCTLPGASKGIEFYITRIDWEKLKDANVWKAAATQIFFSLGSGLGGLIVLASYNRFHTNALRDTMLITMGNCLVSFLAGFAIFSALGYFAHSLGVQITDVAQGGAGLAFVVYPSAISLMPGETFWAIIFFVMLVALGLGTEFAVLETLCTAICDNFPAMQNKKWAVIGALAIVGFFLGLPMVTYGGSYLVDLIDHYAVGWNVLIIAIGESFCIGWVYGIRNYQKDVEVMLGGSIIWQISKWWWMFNIAFFTPLCTAAIVVFTWVGYKPFKLSGYDYPAWAHVMGALCTALCLLAMVATAFWTLFKTEGENLKEKFLTLIIPSMYWGPALVKHRLNVAHIDNFVLDPWNEEVAKDSNKGDLVTSKF